MFKYLLLKTICDIPDADVVERSRYGMSFEYIPGLNPESTALISPGSLCRFRKLGLTDRNLLNLLTGRTVAMTIEKGIIKSKPLIADATHTGSRSNPYSPVEILKSRSRQLHKSLYDADDAAKDKLPVRNTDDDLDHEPDYTRRLLNIISSNEMLVNIPKVRERLNMPKEVLSGIEDHCTTSEDSDARIGHRSEDSSFFGCKTRTGMSDERIITAATVTSGEKGDGLQLPELIKQSRAGGMAVETVVGNTAYSGRDHITLSQNEEEGFEPVAKLNSAITNGARVRKMINLTLIRMRECSFALLGRGQSEHQSS
jgi:hypothetical protein